MNRPLAYPLQTEALTAGMLFYVSFGILFLLLLVIRGMAPQLALIWLPLSASTLLIYIGLLFGYGMDIVRTTAANAPAPPALRGSMTKIAESKVQLLRQLIVTGLFAALAAQLQLRGFGTLGILAWVALFLMLPAFVIHNTFYESVAAMLNPASLVKTLHTVGWTLLPLFGLQALGVVFGIFSFISGLLLYLVCFPCALYCQFLYFHVIGLRVRAHPEAFFALVDFKADRAELKALSDKLAPLDAELSEAYEWLRAGELERVIDKMDLLLKRNGWNDFERLFKYVAHWHSSAPAVHLCRRYLDKPEALVSPMRALELAQWCLGKEAGFTLGNEALHALAERAVIREHYRTVLRMLENHLARYPDARQREPLLRLALNLAADKLKDEQSYARLKEGVSP